MSAHGDEPASSSAERAKDLCLTALGLNCLRVVLEDVADLDGMFWLAIGIVVGGTFWIALGAWGWFSYRERRSAAGGSTAALVRPWVLPLVLAAGAVAGAFFVASPVTSSG